MLKQIQYFQSVVRNHSFSKAAEENYISQSAISQQIQTLERELGFPLLERKNRSFTLTPAGAYLYEKSLVWVADYTRMYAQAADIANGTQAALKIGYLRCDSGNEFPQALAQFSEQYPEVAISILSGNHEELYTMLRTGQADVVWNDQRRAFSEEYVNCIVTTCSSFVAVSSYSPLAQMEKITPQELKNTPCILICSPSQREVEQEYYHTIIGVSSTFLYAENLEEARLMIIGQKGFLPIEGSGMVLLHGIPVTRIPLMRNKAPILRKYCLFYKKDNPNRFITAFAQILQAQFPS